mgnify:FL=1
MVIFIGILIFAAIIGFYACFGRRINENIGSGFGKEYMKDKWGIEVTDGKSILFKRNQSGEGIRDVSASREEAGRQSGDQASLR